MSVNDAWESVRDGTIKQPRTTKKQAHTTESAQWFWWKELNNHEQPEATTNKHEQPKTSTHNRECTMILMERTKQSRTTRNNQKQPETTTNKKRTHNDGDSGRRIENRFRILVLELLGIGGTLAGGGKQTRRKKMSGLHVLRRRRLVDEQGIAPPAKLRQKNCQKNTNFKK